MTKRYSVLTVFIFLLTNIFSQSVNALKILLIRMIIVQSYDVGKRIIIDEFDQGFVPPSMSRFLWLLQESHFTAKK